jgi:N-acetylglutamate synthase-like GNAT family acetyltransferase
VVGVAADDSGEHIVASARVVRVGMFGILRSVAVDEELRRHGIGALVVAHAVRETSRSSPESAPLGTVVLLTETTPGFFTELGFRPIERRDLPAEVRDHPHLQECEGAEAMVRTVGPSRP